MDQEAERTKLPWTDKEVQQLQELARQGLYATEIGQRLRRSRHSAYWKIRRKNIEWPAALGWNLRSQERHDMGKRLRAEYEDGASVRTLVNEYGYSYGKVHRLLHEAGTTLRRRGGRPKPSRAA